MALNMDDSAYYQISLGLQKDSEFLGIFNHYLLKEMEHGINMREARKLQNNLYTNEVFSRAEPQPMGGNNVMFLISLLGFGISASVIVAILEVACKHLSNRKERRDSCRRRKAWSDN